MRTGICSHKCSVYSPGYNAHALKWDSCLQEFSSTSKEFIS